MKTTTKLKTANNPKEFVRLIHSTGDLRKGIGLYRKTLKIETISEIVRDLSKSTIYAKNVVLNPFPKTIEDLRPWYPLPVASKEVEFVWTASILAIFVTELNFYVSKREAFYEAYLLGHFEDATIALDEIESKLGLSLWSIDARLRLLQCSQGLPAQKHFLEKTISQDSINPFAAYLIFYLSFSCEENVTLADVARELDEIEAAGVGATTVDYFRFRINPFDLINVRNPSECLRMDENCPIIDRFETFVQMAQLEFVNSPEHRPLHLKISLALLEKIDDVRLRDLRTVLAEDSSSLRWDSSGLEFCDEYTQGDYVALSKKLDAIISQRPTEVGIYELATRSRAQAGAAQASDRIESLSENILEQMRSVLELKGDMVGTHISLQHIALMCRGHPISRLLAAFLQPNRQMAAGIVTSEDALWALNAGLTNPWSHEPIRKLLNRDWLGGQCRASFPNSVSLQLHNTLLMDLDEAQKVLNELAIPDARRSAYRGHSYFRNDHLDLAVANYRSALDLDPQLGVIGCGLPLFSALFSMGNIPACLDLVVSQYLRNPNTHVLFPLADLLEIAGSIDGNAAYNLDLALTAQIFASHTGPRFNGVRSDAFENVLDQLSLEKASEINPTQIGVELDRTVLFLRKVCAIETLEDSTVFDTYEEVETERIRILQRLIEFDAVNEDEYSAEIRELTEAMEVAKLLEEFEGSRIYVDERGVLRPIEGELRDAFGRFKQLLSEPALEYQADDIKKRIRELIDRSDRSVDMSNFHLPATEKEGLFRRMYSALVNAFVLDPHYGLKTYLSTNVLHGALEGELRHALGRRGLLINSEPGQLVHHVKSIWSDKLGNYVESDWVLLANAFGRFSKRVGDLVSDLKNNQVRIRLEGSPEGLINFAEKDDALINLLSRANANMEFADFVGLLFQHIWGLTEISLAKIQSLLTDGFARSINAALDVLQLTIERDVEKSKSEQLLNAIVMARTEFDLDIQRVVGWFTRKPDRGQTPFYFETAVRVAVKATNNCFPRTPLNPYIDVSVPERLRGIYLDPMVYVLSNCLQNAVQRSGFIDCAPEISISASVEHNNLQVCVANDIAPEVNLADRRLKTESLMLAANAGIDPSMVSGEGGTGFRKIRRSLSLDIGVEPTLKAEIADNRRFILEFSLPFESLVDR